MRRSSAVRGSTATVSPQIARYEDHFSLQAPTSIVRFADKRSAARVIYSQDTNSQLVIEERIDPVTKKRHISIKQMTEEAGGALQFLRLLYTLVAAFFMGFLFCFAIQVLLLVFFDLAVYLGYTDVQKDPHYGLAVGVFFTIPIFIHGLALMMMLAGFWVMDLWQGHYFFKKFVFPTMPQEILEWVFLLGLLVFPLLVIAAALFARADDWWEIGSLYWFYSVLAFYCVFILAVLLYEARTYLQIIQQSDIIENTDSWWGRITALIAVRKRNTLSGYSTTSYSSFGSPEFAWSSEESKKYLVEGTLRENQRNIWTRFSQMGCLQPWMFTTMDPPKRMYCVDDVMGRRPYVTSITWGLEKYFCRPRKGRYVSLLNGPGAITSAQLVSALICNFLGVALVYIMVAAFLVYQGFGQAQLAMALVVILILTIPFWLGPFKSYLEIRKAGMLKDQWKEFANKLPSPKLPSPKLPHPLSKNKTNTAAADDNDNSQPAEGAKDEAPVVVDESEFVDAIEGDEEMAQALRAASAVTPDGIELAETAQPMGNSTDKSSSSLSWTGFGDKVADNTISRGVYHVREKYRITQPTKCLRIFFFLLETAVFLVYPTVSIYYVEDWQLATVFAAIAILTTLRHYTNAEVILEELGQVFAPSSDKTKEDVWEQQSRLSQVAGTISRGKSYRGWRWTFWFFAAAFFVLLIGSRSAHTEGTSTYEFTLVEDYYYPAKNSLHYTSCNFTQNIQGNLPAAMLDYVFFVLIAYRTPEATQSGLEKWYGRGTIQDRSDIVTAFRVAEKDDTPVSYKLFTYQEADGPKPYAIVSIKGSTNAWDWFTNAQLWGSAGLLQIVREILPFGFMWTPILDHMVNLLTNLQSGTLSRMAFYKSTTAFVNHLKASGNYTSIVVTGHSLGGGLAIITGAQTQVQAVGVSAPNAIMSRDRFGVTKEYLEQYTFNIIPDRDMVPRIDDPTKNIQRIGCNAPMNTIFGCHNNRLALCETMLTCGSHDRPAICECATQFDFPEPIARPGANKTFEELCGHTRESS